jgi:DNA-binding NtrC family response regulator
MNKQISILIIENEPATRDLLAKWFTEEGSTVNSAENTAEALRQLQFRHWHIILLDINMPDIDLTKIQQCIRRTSIPPSLILITAQTSVDSALQVLKMGAFDYITKPIDPDHLARVIANSIKQQRLEEENIKLKELISEFTQADEIIGEFQQMKKVFDAIQEVSPTDATVMVRGESGTGKELIARAIHANSKRRFNPIVTINCGGLPEEFLKGELFGYERDTSNGSQNSKKGKIELVERYS